MLALLAGMSEFSRAFDNWRKLTLLARTVADLVSQGDAQNPFSASAMADILAVAPRVLRPFDASGVQIAVSALGVDTTKLQNGPQVCSAAASGTTARALGPAKDLAVPPGYQTQGMRYVLVEVKGTYAPMIGAPWSSSSAASAARSRSPPASLGRFEAARPMARTPSRRSSCPARTRRPAMAPRPDPAARRRAGHPARRFAGDRGGNITILFAFLLLPMLIFGGAAVDYGAAMRMETAAGRDRRDLAPPVPDAAEHDECRSRRPRPHDPDRADGGGRPRGRAARDHQQPAPDHADARKLSTVFFGRITGTQSINPVARAQCATPIPRTFEIALVLDNTAR